MQSQCAELRPKCEFWFSLHYIVSGNIINFPRINAHTNNVLLNKWWVEDVFESFWKWKENHAKIFVQSSPKKWLLKVTAVGHSLICSYFVFFNSNCFVQQSEKLALYRFIQRLLVKFSWLNILPLLCVLEHSDVRMICFFFSFYQF